MTPRKRRQRLDSIHEIADQLRQSAGVPAPDLTDSILDRVGESRPFLDRRTRRMLWVGRGAIGLSVAVVGLGVALTHRWAPQTVDLVTASAPAPLSSVVESVRHEAGERLVNLRVAVDQAATVESGSNSAPTGGLLTLVASAAPIAPARTKTACCTICGPMIPPAEAAKIIPSSMLTRSRPAAFGETDVLAQSSIVDSGVFVHVGLASFPADFGGLAGAHSANGVTNVSGLFATSAVAPAPRRPVRSPIEELAPLGIGPSADSVLAPK